MARGGRRLDTLTLLSPIPPCRGQVIAELDEKKREALAKTWRKVDADFGSIFATLLPGTSAKLEPPEGASFLAGARRLTQLPNLCPKRPQPFLVDIAFVQPWACMKSRVLFIVENHNREKAVLPSAEHFTLCHVDNKIYTWQTLPHASFYVPCLHTKRAMLAKSPAISMRT